MVAVKEFQARHESVGEEPKSSSRLLPGTRLNDVLQLLIDSMVPLAAASCTSLRCKTEMLMLMSFPGSGMCFFFFFYLLLQESL